MEVDVFSRASVLLVLAILASAVALAKADDEASWGGGISCAVLDVEGCRTFWSSQLTNIQAWYYEELFFCEIDQGEFEAARTHADALIALQPSVSTGHFLRASVSAQQEDWKAAIGDYETAWSLGMAGYWLYFDMATAYDEAGQSNEALRFINAAIRIRPDHMDGYLNRSLIYDNLGLYNLSLKDTELVIEKLPSYATAYNNKCWVLAKFMKRYEEALPFCERALELDPDDAEALHSRGYVFLELGQKQEAVADFRHAAELGNESDFVRDDLARALAQPD